jgi:hypothetical protein
MLLPSSGRHNFQDLTVPDELLLAAEPNDLFLCKSRANMCLMLALEEKLRKSSSVQRLLTDFPECGENIFASLQYKVAKEIGFKDPKLGRLAIRAAATLFPGDTALLNIASYRKYNRSAPCKLSVGQLFPDLPLYALDTNNCFDNEKENTGNNAIFMPLPLSKHYQHILDMSNDKTNASWPMAESAPLVLLAGSGSWPPFLEFVDTFNALKEEFCGRAAFACVYLSEAHAKDEWPLGSIISNSNAPTNLQGRMKEAVSMIENTGLKMPILVDGMDDLFGTTYSAWPLRYFVIGANGKLLWIAEPDEVTNLFEPMELRSWLEKYFN